MFYVSSKLFISLRYLLLCVLVFSNCIFYFYLIILNFIYNYFYVKYRGFSLREF